MNKSHLTLVLSLIGLAVIGRFALAGVPNVSPMAAMALFAGATLSDKRWAMLIPLLAMLIGDMFFGFHNTMIFVYLALAITVGLGFLLARHACSYWIIGASLTSSVLFFVLTNFGVWLLAGYYPMTLDGLLTSYVAAIPFFQQTVLGDLFFSALIFGAYYALTFKFPMVAKKA